MKIEPVSSIFLLWLTVLCQCINNVAAKETAMEAYCQFTTDIQDWSEPRFLVNLAQKGSDDNTSLVELQVYNIGKDGDELSVDTFESIDCAGDATTIVDGGITVTERWGQSKTYYRSYLDDVIINDFASMAMADSNGMQLGCCNVRVTGNRKLLRGRGNVN